MVKGVVRRDNVHAHDEIRRNRTIRERRLESFLKWRALKHSSRNFEPSLRREIRPLVRPTLQARESLSRRKERAQSDAQRPRRPRSGEWGEQTLKQECDGECPDAQYAFKDSMIH